jgi:hypothetical protein
MPSQSSLKPQDLVVLLKLAASRSGSAFSYSELGNSIKLSASATYAAVRRARASRLLHGTAVSADDVDRSALREFVVHGARYAFPATVGPMTRGLPTAYAAPPLRDMIAHSAEPPPVWPSSAGSARGTALYPLYPSVPAAAENDPALYELLALFDAIRSGTARERELAGQLLAQRLL